MELFHRKNVQHGTPEMKEQIFNRIIDLISISSSDILLDIGSGDGFYSSKFTDRCAKVIAIDQHVDVTNNRWYDNPFIEVVAGDACDWIAHHQLDVINHLFFSNSFHDLPCQDEILKFISTKCPDGVSLHFIEFKLDTLFGPPKRLRFSKEDLKEKVAFYGFVEQAYLDLDTHYFMSFRLNKNS
ncbi:MAG: rRNA adenine N-6-methyltransferase family protein [Microbacter sp.]